MMTKQALVTLKEDVPAGFVLPPGLVDGICSKCKRAVVISPIMMRSIKENKLATICAGCFDKQDHDVVIGMLPRGGAEELRKLRNHSRN
jgi:hypothetical protein